ncbi:MAG: serine protease [Zhongshania sp.]|uniref:S1 family peptidase n=1 Tax=Zhongshania sp. TaxID=1971902 RepID=UPI0026268193|nr:serine protease [Zhongshania sp.]MDF1692612.1 serine protease [Zhongshania sp.]
MKQWMLLAAILALSACGGGSSSSNERPEQAGVPGESTPAPSIATSYGVPSASQIRPGVLVSADGSSCTGNFLYSPNAQTVYIGVAAHCFSVDANSGVDPCESNNLAIGFNQVIIENASQPGELVYTSWRAMQEMGETAGSAVCTYNDFALVKIHANDIAKVHPAAIAFGGPIGLYTGIAKVGDGVYAYGQSPYHFGRRSRETKQGKINAVLGGGWAYDIVTDTASVPGDSGGPVFSAGGKALAVTSVLSLNLSPTLVSNGVANLDRALRYAIDGGFINASTKLLSWPDFYPAGDL